MHSLRGAITRWALSVGLVLAPGAARAAMATGSPEVDGGSADPPSPEASADAGPRSAIPSAVVLGATSSAEAVGPAAAPPEPRDLATRPTSSGGGSDDRKTEWAALPVLGGGSDIGVLFGATAVITGVGGETKPYRWQLDVIASTSVKSGPRGAELVQQGWGGRLDVPRIFGTRYRYTFGAFYSRTVNELYFGVGNQAAPDPSTVTSATLGLGQYVNEEVRIRNVLRFPLVAEAVASNRANETWTGQVGLQLRALHAQPYAGSFLANDLAARTSSGERVIQGEGLQGVLVPSLGVLYDTRDREVLTRTGAFHEVSLRFAGVAPATESTYGAAHATFRGYTLLPGKVILAGRVVVDAIFGDAPVFDLSQYGSFTPSSAIGGEDGVRGVPAALFYGRLKAFGNVEVRRMLFGARPFGTSLEVGVDAFFDAGRVWQSYTFDDRRDGRTLGLKVGVGGGLLVLWGQAALFRAEIAYSPDANIANPGFPAAIYVADDVIF
ncbi:MAG: BamA/TamA family outer membrane protein [Myxococcales bacterium]|nr:BamA/TamA family outer membrane protein [Myxococcales bacterium]